MVDLSVTAGATNSSGRLLTTMAIVRAIADDGGDYLSCIEPFVDDCLKVWPGNAPVTPELLSRALCDAFEFPAVPIHLDFRSFRRRLMLGPAGVV
jgi:hypothetical protein